MTAKDFLIGKTLVAIELAENLIINLVTDESIYGMDVDTSSIEFKTILTRTDDFEIVDDILTSGELTIDLSTTEMLGSKEF